MKNILKYIGISSILLFSFYYTEKMSNIVINNSSLVMQINENIDDYNVLAVSAEINGDYITPGLNGSKVNVLKSYNNMKFLDTFNSYYLVYDKEVPKISLENNKDKIIKNGNYNKQSIALIVKNNQDVINYSKDKNIAITRIVDLKTYDKYSSFEQINNEVENFESLEKILTTNNQNKNICVINNYNYEICKNKKKYLVEHTVGLTNYNLGNIKNNIQNGYIINVNDDVSLTDYKILIRQIYYQDLNVVSLSELITEERD